MKTIDLFNLDGKVISKIELPKQFDADVRPDLVKRAFLSARSSSRQRYGASPDAGKRPSAKLPKRRKHYKTSYGYGISRVPRKIMSRRGRRMIWVGAFAPGMVGGRRAHPPKSEKNLVKKINKKEKKLAICSAIASLNMKVLEQKIESLTKTKELFGLLNSIKINIGKKKLIAGKGKLRRGRYKTKKGPLIVVSADCPLLKRAKNLAGVDITVVNSLNIQLLAPGGVIGRTTIWSEGAIKKLKEENLFAQNG